MPTNRRLRHGLGCLRVQTPELQTAPASIGQTGTSTDEAWCVSALVWTVYSARCTRDIAVFRDSEMPCSELLSDWPQLLYVVVKGLLPVK